MRFRITRLLLLGLLVAAVAWLLLLFTGFCFFVAIQGILDTEKFAEAVRVEGSDEAALAIPDEDLPPYTILVPAYNEPEVVGDLIGARLLNAGAEGAFIITERGRLGGVVLVDHLLDGCLEFGRVLADLEQQRHAIRRGEDV